MVLLLLVAPHHQLFIASEGVADELLLPGEMFLLLLGLPAGTKSQQENGQTQQDYQNCDQNKITAPQKGLLVGFCACKKKGAILV
jgi:hypothetical protein